MRHIHIIDDIPCVRKVIREEIESSLGRDSVDPSSPKAIAELHSEWKYIWHLTESKSQALRVDDIVISDLFPVSYWEKAPGKPLYKPESPLPEDPTNIYLAALDAIQRFMRPVAERGAHLLVVTFVPNFLEIKMRTKEAADHVREVLDGEELIWFPKPTQDSEPEYFTEAVGKVCELVKGS